MSKTVLTNGVFLGALAIGVAGLGRSVTAVLAAPP